MCRFTRCQITSWQVAPPIWVSCSLLERLSSLPAKRNPVISAKTQNFAQPLPASKQGSFVFPVPVMFLHREEGATVAKVQPDVVQAKVVRKSSSVLHYSEPFGIKVSANHFLQFNPKLLNLSLDSRVTGILQISVMSPLKMLVPPRT